MAEAHRLSEQRRRELTDIAAAEVATMEARWKENVERQREAFARNLSQRAGDQVCSIARLALADLAGTDLERHIVDVFTERLHALPEATRRRIVDTVHKSNYHVTVSSSFALDEAQQAGIHEALKKLVGHDVTVTNEVSPDVICGIDLRAHEYKLAFSLGDYLERLRIALEAELQAEASAREGG